MISTPELVLYANARECKFGEEWEIAYWDFFCVARRVHLVRETRWKHRRALPEFKWSKPSPCDETCTVWRERELDMPEDTEQALRNFLKSE